MHAASRHLRDDIHAAHLAQQTVVGLDDRSADVPALCRVAQHLKLGAPQVIGRAELVQDPQDLVVVGDVIGGELERDYSIHVG